MTRGGRPLAAAPAASPGPNGAASWLRVAAAAAAAAGLVFGLGWQLARPTGRGDGAEAAELEARLAAVYEALATERAAREALANELLAVRAQTDLIAAQLLAAAPALATGGAGPTAPVPDEQADAEATGATDAPPQPLFDLEALVAGCMHRGEAETLRARWERYELDRLDLNDRAMREGFFMTPQHGEQRFALDAAFRNDVNDDGYDAYLRATDKPNRVAVREVLPAGAGRVAGLEVGDELVQYAGVRVFSVADLQLLTASGRLGETVAVDVMRSGQPLTLRAVRGPLGIVLDAVQRGPKAGC